MAKHIGLKLLRIDVDRSIIYLKGSVPRKPGSIVKTRDTVVERNRKKIDLVLQREGVEYIRQFSIYCDPASIDS